MVEQKPKRPGGFQKGFDPRRKAGGAPRNPEVRAALVALLPECAERLTEMLRSGDPDNVKFAVDRILNFGLAKPAAIVGADELEKLKMLGEALRGD